MEGIRVPVLLLLLLLGLTWSEPTSLTEDFSLSQAEVLKLSIDTYNEHSGEEYAFRVLEAQQQPDWDPTLLKPQSLSFIIKETNCKIVEKLTPEKCPFKDDGQVKNCSVLFKTGEEDISVELTCEPQKPTGVARARRGLKKFFKKVKKVIKKLIPKKGVGIQVSRRF
ncbi:cathelicidin-related peptide Pt_CRAMP1-like [Trichechus inunguis]